MKVEEKDLKQIIMGDYVLTPIKNAFNKKHSYWVSKKGYTLSLYMFTIEDCLNEKDLEDRLSYNNVKIYLAMLEETCQRSYNYEVYIKELHKLEDTKK